MLIDKDTPRSRALQRKLMTFQTGIGEQGSQPTPVKGKKGKDMSVDDLIKRWSTNEENAIET